MPTDSKKLWLADTQRIYHMRFERKVNKAVKTELSGR